MRYCAAACTSAPITAAALVGLGVPLDAEHEAALGQLDGLHEVVDGRRAGDHEPLAQLVDALVVMGLGGVQELAGGVRRQRLGDEADVVVGLVEVAGHAPVVLVAEGLGQVLDERAAKGDVEDLHAAADAEHRHVELGGAPDEGELEGVALAAPALGLGVGLGAVGGRVHIDAAGDDQAVEAVQKLVGIAHQLGLGGDHERQAAGAAHLAHVAGGQDRGVLIPDAVAGLGERRGDADCGAVSVHGPSA